MGRPPQPLKRPRLLPAYVEIMLADGDLEAARAPQRGLDEIAARQGTDMLGAMAAQARGEVALADGDAEDALDALRHASQAWHGTQALRTMPPGPAPCWGSPSLTR